MSASFYWMAFSRRGFLDIFYGTLANG